MGWPWTGTPWPRPEPLPRAALPQVVTIWPISGGRHLCPCASPGSRVVPVPVPVPHHGWLDTCHVRPWHEAETIKVAANGGSGDSRGSLWGVPHPLPPPGQEPRAGCGTNPRSSERGGRAAPNWGRMQPRSCPCCRHSRGPFGGCHPPQDTATPPGDNAGLCPHRAPRAAALQPHRRGSHTPT